MFLFFGSFQSDSTSFSLQKDHVYNTENHRRTLLEYLILLYKLRGGRGYRFSSSSLVVPSMELSLHTRLVWATHQPSCWHMKTKTRNTIYNIRSNTLYIITHIMAVWKVVWWVAQGFNLNLSMRSVIVGSVMIEICKRCRYETAVAMWEAPSLHHTFTFDLGFEFVHLRFDSVLQLWNGKRVTTGTETITQLGILSMLHISTTLHNWHSKFGNNRTAILSLYSTSA